MPLSGGEVVIQARGSVITVTVDRPEVVSPPLPLAFIPLTSPPDWLYVSRRLDLLTLPNEPPFTPLLFSMTPSTPSSRGAHLDRPKPPPAPVSYYRLTPTSLAWFERAASHFETEYSAGRFPRSEMDECVRVMEIIWEFAREVFRVEDVLAARGAGSRVELPEREAGAVPVVQAAMQVGRMAA